MSVHRVSPPGWPANVVIAYSTRDAGRSVGPWSSFNLATHVGDDPAAVDANRALLARTLGADTRIAWLRQVHGTAVVDAQQCLREPADADGCWTAETGLACAVLTADCLPIVLADTRGEVVAAIHAGWRGLADGVIDAALAVLPAAPGSLLAWLGACIGTDAYEVGSEVRATFLTAGPIAKPFFRVSPRRDGHYLLDLQGLAEAQLRRLGVASVTSLNACTASQPGDYFSYRRDGVSGRMVTLVQRIQRLPQSSAS